MRALVTGSSGFVGRHILDHLDRTGWDTAGVDIADGYDAVEYFRHGTARWDLVVHAAASAPHRAAIDGEHVHMARNLQLDAAMFDWAVRTGQRRVVYLSSSAAYPVALQRGPGMGGPLSEDLIDLGHADEPDSVYGWAKLTGERMAAQARKAGLAVTVVRPFSGYGEDQSENFPFRAMIERARRREDPFIIWGNGDQVRDWIHIDDVVQGLMAVVTAQRTLEADGNQPVNLCTGHGWSMSELAHVVCDRAGYKPTFQYLTDRPTGVAFRVGDPYRLSHYYKPRMHLVEGVERALKSS